MARFDLFRVNSRRIPLMVDVQAEILGDLASRVVIPLRVVDQAGEPPLPGLKPVLVIGGQSYLLLATDTGAQPIHWLGKPVGNIKEHRDEITSAMDFLFQGF
ncbi:CcdB family protein [Maricaulis salignorans]|uniref:Toxin CcdB n=1 Tax=Maricaulis salignorans TaxID=144026 RepID=A0A1G9QI85_9PROT|nr:CcdB family protein [Maricaulis salignorans]SDM10005.1 toxin CcdB [Maricaulis salignorans]